MSNQPDSLELAKAAANKAAQSIQCGLPDLGNAWANLAHAHAAIAAFLAQEDA